MVYKLIMLLLLLIVAAFCVLIFMQLRLISKKMDDITYTRRKAHSLNEGFRGMQ